MVALRHMQRPAIGRRSSWVWAAAALAATPSLLRALLDRSMPHGLPQLAPVISQAAVIEVAPPKRPKNAYMHFAAATRAKYAEPGTAVTEVSKALGEDWRSMKPKDRKKWETQAEKDKTRFEKELQIFTDAGHEMPKRKRKGEKSASSRPKRAPSAYNLYVKDRFPAVSEELGGETRVGVVGKKIGEEWRSLSESKKAKWVKEAAALKAAAADPNA